MILAAGFGTRMRPLTDDRPKPLIRVAGKALIDHAIEAAGPNAGPIAVNGHYRADQLAGHLQGSGVHFLHEAPEILDSGGGVRNALPVLGQGAIGTLNADAVWTGPPAIETLLAAWDETAMGGLLLLVPMAHAVGRLGGGDFSLADDGRITPDKAGLVYTGAQILGPGIVGRWPEGAFSMWQIWQALLDEGRLFGCIHPGSWADIGHPAGIPLAEDMLKKTDV